MSVGYGKFVGYGKYKGKPAKVVYDNGKITSEPKEIAEKVMEFIELIRQGRYKTSIFGFRIWQKTVDVPYTYRFVITRYMEVDRWEGTVPSVFFPGGVKQFESPEEEKEFYEWWSRVRF